MKAVEITNEPEAAKVANERKRPRLPDAGQWSLNSAPPNHWPLSWPSTGFCRDGLRQGPQSDPLRMEAAPP
jgi:hypothetical protein